MPNEIHYSPRLEWFLLAGASISICFAGFATLGVTTLLPAIAENLNGQSMYPLANGTALAGQLIATAIAGAWCDSRGAVRPLLLGLLFFIAGLLTCGLAPSMFIFILGRMLQGLGGGLLMVSMYVLVGALVSPLRRPFFFGAFAGAWVIPALIGPYIAGKIDSYLGWRAVFHILVPAILMAAAIIMPLLRHIPRHHNPLAAKARRTVLGATVAFIALIVAQFGLTLDIPGGKIAALGALFVLVLSIHWLLPKGTISLRKGLPSMVASRGFINAAYVATETFIPLILVQAHKWDVSQAALVISAGSITWATGALVQSKLPAGKIRMRLPFFGGILAAGGGIFTALAAFPTLPASLSVIGWCISAFGVGISYPALSVLALESAPEEKHGYISSTLQLADSLGGAAALTIITTAFTYLSHLPAPGPMLPAMLLTVLLGIGAGVAGKRIGKLVIK
ncbi:MFS transporter [Actinomycetaceae bacterium TAE3-ERU4]|nr:MFS transporter [Actinomycetaceae bacterium TAE3-ERU4]